METVASGGELVVVVVATSTGLQVIRYVVGSSASGCSGNIYSRSRQHLPHLSTPRHATCVHFLSVEQVLHLRITAETPISGGVFPTCAIYLLSLNTMRPPWEWSVGVKGGSGRVVGWSVVSGAERVSGSVGVRGGGGQWGLEESVSHWSEKGQTV